MGDAVIATIMSFAVHGLDETGITKLQEVSPQVKTAIVQNLSLFNTSSCILEIQGNQDESVNGIWHLKSTKKCAAMRDRPTDPPPDPASPHYIMRYTFASAHSEAILDLSAWRFAASYPNGAVCHILFLDLTPGDRLGSANNNPQNPERLAPHETGVWHPIIATGRDVLEPVFTPAEEEQRSELSGQILFT